MSRCVSEIFGDMIYVCVVVVCEWEITKSVVVWFRDIRNDVSLRSYCYLWMFIWRGNVGLIWDSLWRRGFSHASFSLLNHQQRSLALVITRLPVDQTHSFLLAGGKSRFWSWYTGCHFCGITGPTRFGFIWLCLLCLNSCQCACILILYVVCVVQMRLILWNVVYYRNLILLNLLWRPTLACSGSLITYHVCHYFTSDCI